MKFTKILAAVAVSAAFIAPASAATMGMADLAITGLAILDSTGAPVLADRIRITTETRTGNASSNFNGVDAVGAGSGNIFAVTTGPVGATVDVKYRCAGPSCGAAHANANYNGGVVPVPASKYENDFSTHIAAPTGNYALGDMFIGGSAIGITGANGLTRADSSVMNSTNAGSANATILNSVTSTAIFTPATTISARFLLGYDSYVAAFVNAGVGIAGTASGAISWALTLQETIGNVSTTIMSWNPNELNVALTSSNLNENVTFTSTGMLFSDFVTLTAGRTYKLGINQASNSVASEVPEPGSMVLVALGLFALGAASRRKAGK